LTEISTEYIEPLELDEEPFFADVAKETPASKKIAKRRAERVADGLNELKTFLSDLIRGGFVNLDVKSRKLFEHRYKRLIDAQAPGVASMLAQCARLIGVNADWRELLLARLGRLAVLIEAYSKIDKVSEEFASEIRQTIGWSIPQKEVLLSGERVEDRWLYLGATYSSGRTYFMRTTWRIGERTKRFAYVVDFARRTQATFPKLDPIVPMEGALRFFPGTSKLRALWEEENPPIPSPTPEASYDELASTIPDLFASVSERLAKNPWLERFPALLRDVVIRPLKSGDVLSKSFDRVLIDAQGRVLPVAPINLRDKESFWNFVAVSMKRPITVFGEWNGRKLTLISAWDRNRAVLIDKVQI